MQGTFHALQPNSKTIMPRNAMMMKSTRKTYFGLDVKELGGGHCALLEYGNADESGDDKENSFGAFFFLPEKNTHQSMQSMISSLTSFMTKSDKKNKRQMTESVKPLHHLMDNILLESKVALTIPRFKVSYGIKSLKSELQSLGITEAFNNNGKRMFDEMTSDPLVYLDEVYHKAVMEVNEEGTVAAASTAAVMMTRSIPRPPPELVFDRPFIMLVVHLETGLPLFMSKVDDPELL